MNTLLAGLFLFVVARIVWRSAPRHQTFMPQDTAERLDQFHERLDVAVGLKTPEYEAMLARGIAAKRKLLAHGRNRVQVTRTPDWLLFGLQRLGDGPMTRVRLHAKPLRSLQPKVQPSVPVIVRKRISLAR